MYSKIEILDTEYLEKYLLISNNSTLYIGTIVKDVVIFLKYGFDIEMIAKKINEKHESKLSIRDISAIKTNIDIFLTKREVSNLSKIVILFNPSKIPISQSIINTFFKKFFYSFLFLSLFINCFASTWITHSNTTTSTNETIIIAISVFAILLFHELGHSFSAKGFNVNVKEIGFGFYYILPVLYVNLKESWKLKSDKRIIINLSGIYFQLIIGSFLAIYICFFDQNKVLTSIFKVNLSIILLNVNPFLKFDGYWILSDLLNETNLLKTSNNLIKNKFKTINKTNNWIVTYTILRIIFIVCIVSFAVKKTIDIYIKYIEHTELNIGDGFFLLILSFYVFKLLIRKFKKK